MDRIIERLPNGVVTRADIAPKETAMSRLAAYEDTGLTPAEIAALRAERDEARRERDAASKTIDIIGDHLFSVAGIEASNDMLQSGVRSALQCVEQWRGADEKGGENGQ